MQALTLVVPIVWMWTLRLIPDGIVIGTPCDGGMLVGDVFRLAT